MKNYLANVAASAVSVNWDRKVEKYVGQYFQNVSKKSAIFYQKLVEEAAKGINLGRIIVRGIKKGISKWRELGSQEPLIPNVISETNQRTERVKELEPKPYIQDNVRTSEDNVWLKESKRIIPENVVSRNVIRIVPNGPSIVEQIQNFSWSLQSMLGADFNLGAVRGGEPRVPGVDLTFGYMAPVNRMIVPRVGRVSAY